MLNHARAESEIDHHLIGLLAEFRWGGSQDPGRDAQAPRSISLVT